MLKISYAGCLGLSPAILLQFSVEMCTASKNCEKFTKTPFWGSRSFSIIDVDKSKKPITNACYNNKQHVCTYLQPFSHYMSQ